MIRNYFKIAYRNLLRNKSFSIINISGLASAMASAILILLWVQNEVSYDRFHANGDRLYQVYSNDVINNSIRSLTATPEIMAPTLKNDVPEIDKVSRISWGESYLFTVGDKTLMPHGNSVDPDFLSMFSFPIKEGDVNALNDPYSVVLTEKLAKNIFGNEDPIGKMIAIQRSTNCKVTGVLKDLPNNTQFNFEYLLSYANKSTRGDIDSDWTDISIPTFVLLKPNSSLNSANEKIKNVIVKHSGGRATTKEFLYPVSKLRLYSNFENGVAVGGRIERVRIFSLIAVFKRPRGFAIAGLILGLVGSIWMLVAGLAMVLSVLGIGVAAKAAADHLTALQSAQQAYAQIEQQQANSGAPPSAAAADALVRKYNDPWGTPLRAEVNNGQITIRSAGRDKAFDTSDDIRIEQSELQLGAATAPPRPSTRRKGSGQ